MDDPGHIDRVQKITHNMLCRYFLGFLWKIQFIDPKNVNSEKNPFISHFTVLFSNLIKKEDIQDFHKE